MTVLCLIWGILAIVGMIIAFFPCLGSLNWLNIPFSIVGAVISIIVLAMRPAGAEKGGAVAGVVLCAIAALLGFLRLVAGGGVL